MAGSSARVRFWILGFFENSENKQSDNEHIDIMYSSRRAELTVRPRLLVLTSTYPRWPDDQEPGFVHELCKRLTDDFDVTVLSPHAPGATTVEIMDGVHVRRYRYAPAGWETLVNNGGIVTNLRRQPWKWLLVPGFLLKQAWATWRLIQCLRPDVMHAHWLLPQGLLIAVLGRIGCRTCCFRSLLLWA
ncbi:MAG: glycosyltransferase [Gammaproteobacteria bacterium]